MDEVPGQGDQVTGSLKDRSDHHINDIPCDLCAKSEQFTSASGFCRDCNEFLCSICIIYHRKVKSLIDHIILEDDLMPNERPVTINVEKCSKHPDRAVEVYCSDEDVLGCALCFVEGHRTCQNVATILTVLKEFNQSEYIADIHQVAKKQTDLFNRLRETINEHRLKNEQCQSKCLEDFRTFRAEIEAVLDILGEEISQEADKLQKEKLEKLNNLEEMISSHEQHLVSCMQDIDRLAHNQQQLDQLFITVKKSRKRIIENSQQLEQLGDSTHVPEFSFDYDDSIKRLLENGCKIKVKHATKCTDVSTVCIKSPDDIGNCQIRGIMFISTTQFIVSDNSNKCLKLYDMESNTILQRRSLSSAPFDITELPGIHVAVALPNEKQILFFTADQNMDRQKSIQVNGNCRGLQCTGDRLVVVCHKPVPQIQILDFEGNVIQSIQYDPSQRTLLKNPMYLTLDSKNQCIYVGDYDKNTVQSVNVSGLVQWVYEDEELQGSMGIVTGYGGCIYICSWRNHTIHVVSRDGTKLAIIPKSESGVINPGVLSFSSQNQTLYVACGGPDICNNISILRLQS